MSFGGPPPEPFGYDKSRQPHQSSSIPPQSRFPPGAPSIPQNQQPPPRGLHPSQAFPPSGSAPQPPNGAFGGYNTRPFDQAGPHRGFRGPVRGNAPPQGPMSQGGAPANFQHAPQGHPRSLGGCNAPPMHRSSSQTLQPPQNTEQYQAPHPQRMSGPSSLGASVASQRGMPGRGLFGGPPMAAPPLQSTSNMPNTQFAPSIGQPPGVSGGPHQAYGPPGTAPPTPNSMPPPNSQMQGPNAMQYQQGYGGSNVDPNSYSGGNAAPIPAGGYAPQQKQRIDPSQIPRPIVSPERIQYVASGHTVTMPPPASSDYICLDEGCCNPRFIRPTLNHVPASKDLLKQCGIPLAAVITPLAELKDDELPIPLIDFGPTGPLRCSRCRAYVNCYTKFVQAGRKFVCNICMLQNETPREYYCSVDQYGKRRDVQERAELSKGSVDYIVPAAYTVRAPQEPIFVFILDVSVFSFQASLVSAALEAIKYILPSLAQNKRKKVGIVTFDSTVQYYRMDQKSSISIAACSDLEDPPAPLPPESWLVSMEDPQAIQRIGMLADIIIKTNQENPGNQSAAGAALWSVVEALSVAGGRVILLQASAPRLGVGRIRREENTSVYGTTKEVDLYTPEDNSPYNQLAVKCAESHISLDVFSVASPFASLAEIGRVCEVTGGRVHHLPQFEKEAGNNQHHLRQSLLRIVSRDCGYEAVLKVRCSAGLRVDRSFGSFYVPQNRGGMIGSGLAAFTSSNTSDGTGVDEMEFSVIDQDRSICVTLAHDETLSDETDAYIQVALLFTRSDGIRCVRVHNLALPIDNLLSNVFRFADLDATCSVWQRNAAKQIVDKSQMRSPDAIKNQLIEDCVNVLYNYRKHCASSSLAGQLILPESLKLLPLYTLSTLKSVALRPNVTGSASRGFVDVRADDRVMMLGLLNTLPVEWSVSAVYPKLYRLHDMAEECGSFDEDGQFLLPLQLPPTAEKLEEDGLFLLHSAMCCYLYIGPRVNGEVLTALFGTDQVDTAEKTLSLFETQSSSDESFRSRVCDIVEYLNSTTPMSQPLEILTKNDWRLNQFMSALVEDRTRNDVSYVEFLVQVHKKIQYKFH
uniref:Protein transporter Sec24 putative n=1 Tax=Albugo laibachii Nc14 TaxID=890382 RepID=F0WTJ0_9STRA|nr:protein transporter Sec24 putative [Albugo laibachii Nc14]|eukprot:CCA24681.1 protein transporter Sec24 putative [Albugo laibachii Nc14]